MPVKIAIDPARPRMPRWLRAGLSVTAEVDTRGPDAQRLGLFGAAAATPAADALAAPCTRAAESR